MSEPCIIPIEGPVLVFGGNYSNLEATRAVLAQAERLGLTPGNVVCTGDLIGCCADPLATVEVMRRSGVRIVAGNCDQSFGFGGECGCGFEKVGACESFAAEWHSFATQMLGEDARAWLRTLPRRLDLAVGGRKLAVMNSSMQQRIHRRIFASTPHDVMRQEMAGCDGVLTGHSGLPFTEIVDGHVWHNPGAVGMPANDGTSRTWYSTINPGPGGLDIQHHALEYDFAAAAMKMRQIGLSERYALALQDGFWPNCEILPPRELAQRGKPLAAKRITL